MDLFTAFGTIIDFIVLLVVLSAFSFVLYKIFSPLREKLAKRFSLSWVLLAILLNFIIIFVFLVIVFIYFMALGYISAPMSDPSLSFNAFENLAIFFIALPRVIITSIILTLLLLFFEFFASFVMELVPQSKKKLTAMKKTPHFKAGEMPIFSQILGVVSSCALFLLLYFLLFDWVPLGLFVYLFYGGISPLPF